MFYFFLSLPLPHTGGLDGTRPVIVPADTVSRFQSLASTNTRKNIETCGILAGKLVSKYTLLLYYSCTAGNFGGTKFLAICKFFGD